MVHRPPDFPPLLSAPYSPLQGCSQEPLACVSPWHFSTHSLVSITASVFTLTVIVGMCVFRPQALAASSIVLGTESS